MTAEFKVTKKQKAFIDSTADEVLYGGAAGGGKTFAQIIDAFLKALNYPGIKQIILRNSYPELNRSVILNALALIPKRLYSYSGTEHRMRFYNSSLIEFGYLAADTDVSNYQSAEYDIIRFDELTHFTEYQYLYMLSRVRGANGIPKRVKSTTNPGGVGHSWVRARFVDVGTVGTPVTAQNGTRIFIPAKVRDNTFLMKKDPEYIKRLQNLPERERRALLDGDWNIVEGKYFAEFEYGTHTCPEFPIPDDWKRYRAIDYGLDRLACLWVAVDNESVPNFYVYRELCGSDIIISDAARAINAATGSGERILRTAAPPDLWSRSQETGRSKAHIFADSGLRLTKCSNDREAGWLWLKELLKIREDGLPRLRIFRTCGELIRCLPALMIDKNRPSDICTQPHELTHAPDALRYFASYFRESRGGEASEGRFGQGWSEDMWQDYYAADAKGRERIRSIWG